MSKGSKRRPRQVSQEEFDRRWDEAFGKGVPCFVSDEERNQVTIEPLNIGDEPKERPEAGDTRA